MNAKTAKLLRKSCRQFNRSYKHSKKLWLGLSDRQKGQLRETLKEELE